MSFEDVSSRATALRQVVQLIQDASESLISSWENPAPDAVPASETSFAIPGRKAYNAQRTIIAALGSIEELVAEPHLRLVDFAELYFEVRALHIAVEHDIASLLAKGGVDGVPIEELAKKSGLEQSKLGEIWPLTRLHFVHLSLTHISPHLASPDNAAHLPRNCAR